MNKPDYTQDETEEFWRQQREILDARTNPIPKHEQSATSPVPDWLVWRDAPGEPGLYRITTKFGRPYSTLYYSKGDKLDHYYKGIKFAGPIPEPVEPEF